jgi:hypothetical protein
MDAGNQIEDGGFAGAVGADQAADLPWFYGQVEIVHGPESAKIVGHVGYPE